VLDDVGDLLSDLAIWGLASWTVLYHLGRVVGLGTTPVLLASVAVTLALSVTTWRHLPARVGLSVRSVSRRAG